MTTNTLSFYPMLIGLCGAPKSGKSKVQSILHEYHGIEPIDDGAPLRRLCYEMLAHQGIRYSDCTSQEGKMKTILAANDEERELRWTLGEVGNAVEEIFGSNAIPNAAIHNAMRNWDNGKHFPNKIGYSFGSVRRDQGAIYKNNGGFVVEIVRNNTPESKYTFDSYNHRLVDYTIYNNGNISDLMTEIQAMMFNFSERMQNA